MAANVVVIGDDWVRSWRDGHRVAEINDPRLTAKPAPFGVGAFGERGEVTIVGLRAYASASR